MIRASFKIISRKQGGHQINLTYSSRNNERFEAVSVVQVSSYRLIMETDIGKIRLFLPLLLITETDLNCK